MGGQRLGAPNGDHPPALQGVALWVFPITIVTDAGGSATVVQEHIALAPLLLFRQVDPDRMGRGRGRARGREREREIERERERERDEKTEGERERER